jgi:CRISPR/Cas system CSM-associated protein Csm4 (group 5 of RAMP superfamily)
VSTNTATEFIQEKVLANFQDAAKTFYKDLESAYITDLRSRIRNGEIDVDENNIKEVSLIQAKKYEDYIKKTKKLETFVKNYVNDTFDLVCDNLSEGNIEKEEAEVVFNTLRYILTAGKIVCDDTVKLK